MPFSICGAASTFAVTPACLQQKADCWPQSRQRILRRSRPITRELKPLAKSMNSEPIENHGVIGNMRSIALVAMDGTIDFLCFPNFDSPSVFASLLDSERGGCFQIQPKLGNVRARQMYLPDTNILVTRFLSDDGVAELTDYMPIAETDQQPNEIIRTVSTVRGKIDFTMRCEPRFDYARSEHSAKVEEACAIFHPASNNCQPMSLYSTVPIQRKSQNVTAQFTLRAGETATFVFGALRPQGEPPEMTFLGRRFQKTSEFWKKWAAKSKYKGRWREMVNRSALLLKLLISREHGSLIASPTFSLPEHVGGVRNWDYRYTWLRDASFSLYALIRLGFTEEAESFIHWLKGRLGDDAKRGPLQVMYGIDGRQKLDEVALDQDSRPVRIGNAAYQQLQLDIYGEMMDSIYLSNKYGDSISHDRWQDVQRILAWLEKNWRRPDEGIWEVRGGPREFLHSRLMCWVAFDRALRLAQKRSLSAPLGLWLRTRDEIRADIFKNFWDQDLQAFVQSKGTKDLDAAALLMPLMRFISPVDPMWHSTMKAIESRLVEDTLVRRYEQELTHVDGLPGGEGSFTACSFWYVECLARAGDLQKAQLLFEKLLGYANHLGLYAEELGLNGRHLGNFPQAFTHLALISAATYLDRSLSGHDDVLWR
jgi:GH15 family glucan-1,4-alpha-glucosidase